MIERRWSFLVVRQEIRRVGRSARGAKYGMSPCTCAVVSELAVLNNVLEQFEVLLHAMLRELFRSAPCRR